MTGPTENNAGPSPDDAPGSGDTGQSEEQPWVPPGATVQPEPDMPPVPSPQPPPAGPRHTGVDPSWPPPQLPFSQPLPGTGGSPWQPAAPALPGAPPPTGPGGQWGGTGSSPRPGSLTGGWGMPQGAPVAQPGVVPLRPLTLGEILDGAITYIRRNPAATLGTAAVITAVSGVIQLLIVLATTTGLSGAFDPGQSVTADELSSLFASMGGSVGLLLSTVVSYLLSILATGLLTLMMGAAVLGMKLSLVQAWRLVAPRLPALLGLTLLVGLTLTVVFVGISAIGVVIVALSPNILTVLTLLLMLAVAATVTIWLWVRLLLAPVIVVLEKRGPIDSWRRSLALVRGGWWRTLGIQLLALLISWLIGTVVAVPFQVGASLLSSGDPDDTWFWVLITVGSVISGVVTLPFSAGVVSLIYLDRRMRTEGFDVLLQLAASTPSDADLSIYVSGRAP
ncbi:MAG: hypothetical protein KDC39_06175 [Actinobacteria bacterium]|nr:hypothetical protein [Actinomycetota bacterium]